jgi:solute carrier family 45 protein 1/2/4
VVIRLITGLRRSNIRRRREEEPTIVSHGRREEEMASFVGQPSIKGSTETTRMALLTFAAVGLQYVYLLIGRIALMGSA